MYVHEKYGKIWNNPSECRSKFGIPKKNDIEA